ncbi:recombinase family protein [Helcobacillus sp. ACRRO]|uniref:recombinase family protein n=1 Tax=Helcobacillus sp. ACRRO TaxID=2918202 RepID=UPI001EF73EA5|nr:recombinase family protein [Helcobacillus sp. ACRRO]MCG7427054.1 recombinase family protein [Helcobacillus sp. ACRRO]
MGDAMEAITDVVNELQVRMSGEDIKIKMVHKVERGGSVGRAKLGYLNVRKDFNGRLVNTIDVDEERAPLIVWAFVQYATGQYSITQLQAMLENQGLTTRPSAKCPARPLSSSQLAKILRHRYYTGVIRYKGTLYPGRHTPLIEKEVFLAVQKILDGRNRRGDRDRIHFHYLRGLLYCAGCTADGRDSRLVCSQHHGNGGTYEYYVCTAKQRSLCTMCTVPLEAVENAVADLAADGTLNSAKLRERLEAVALQKGAPEEKLSRAAERIHHGVEKVFAYVDLLERSGDLYQGVPDTIRRDLLAAPFSRINVSITDDDLTTTSERTEASATLHEWRTQHRLRHCANSAAGQHEARREKKRSLPHFCGRLLICSTSPAYSAHRIE